MPRKQGFNDGVCQYFCKNVWISYRGYISIPILVMFKNCKTLASSLLWCVFVDSSQKHVSLLWGDCVRWVGWLPGVHQHQRHPRSGQPRLDPSPPCLDWKMCTTCPSINRPRSWLKGLRKTLSKGQRQMLKAAQNNKVKVTISKRKADGSVSVLES